jgi:hypothetical protein
LIYSIKNPIIDINNLKNIVNNTFESNYFSIKITKTSYFQKLKSKYVLNTYCRKFLEHKP